MFPFRAPLAAYTGAAIDIQTITTSVMSLLWSGSQQGNKII